MTIRVMSCLLPEYLKDEPQAKLPYYGDKFDIISVNHWKGFAGHGRQYVNTTVGTFFYDITGDSWGGKDVDILSVDEEVLKAKALTFTGVKTMDEFKLIH